MGKKMIACKSQLYAVVPVVSLQKWLFMDTVLWLCPHNEWNIKVALTAAHLNAEIIPVVTG